MRAGDKNYRLVKIVWEDIASSPDTGWMTVEEALDWADNEKLHVHQVGYLLDDDEDHYVLTNSIFEDGSQVSIITKIPKPVVKKIIDLE